VLLLLHAHRAAASPKIYPAVSGNGEDVQMDESEDDLLNDDFDIQDL
jgi:hypothetical protein